MRRSRSPEESHAEVRRARRCRAPADPADGEGDLILRPEHDAINNITTGYQEIEDASGTVIHDEPASEFVFHPAHNDWHLTCRGKLCGVQIPNR